MNKVKNRIATKSKSNHHSYHSMAMKRMTLQGMTFNFKEILAILMFQGDTFNKVFVELMFQGETFNYTKSLNAQNKMLELTKMDLPKFADFQLRARRNTNSLSKYLQSTAEKIQNPSSLTQLILQKTSMLNITS
jgi:hypothetical protein